MPTPPHHIDLTLSPDDNVRLANLCGQFDQHLRLIERRLGIELANRGMSFRLIGEQQSVEAGERVLRALYEAAGDEVLSPERVHLELVESGADADATTGVDEGLDLIIKTKRGLVKPRGAVQQSYMHAILTHDLNFGVGPAGTGKTYLAVACAVEALENDRVRRLLLVRPAVEAGEHLGFLPGDLYEKVNPYLRPLYDALHDMMDFESAARLLQKGVIEVAPLAFMRGRTLNDSYVILDEAQNATMEQMKMFLTRIGFSSKAVITGDVTQIDLPGGKPSGLIEAREILQGIEGIEFVYFTRDDVIRHPLVQEIIDAYERAELKKTKP